MNTPRWVANSRYRHSFFLLTQIATIFVVLALFRLVHPKELAAIFAGTIFVLMPILQLTCEWIAGRFRNVWLWVAAGQFLIFFALPIFLVRVTHPGEFFWNLKIAGIPAPYFHDFSSKSFFLLIIATATHLALTFRKTKSV